jgi:hypothetical protein
MIYPRIGIAELIIVTVTCLLAIGMPTIIIYFLVKINNKIKNIEDKLKDK